VAVRLNQEFIRIKGTGWKEAEAVRAATLASLVTRTFTSRCIVFFDTKVRWVTCPPPSPFDHPLIIVPFLCVCSC
jgi:hypothetical protein